MAPQQVELLGWASMVNAMTMARHRAADDCEAAACLGQTPETTPTKGSSCRGSPLGIALSGSDPPPLATPGHPGDDPGGDFCQLHRPGPGFTAISLVTLPSQGAGLNHTPGFHIDPPTRVGPSVRIQPDTSLTIRRRPSLMKASRSLSGDHVDADAEHSW
jgi:hypothetical protein